MPPVTAALEISPRYQVVTREKADGATYTPKLLADFVATQITNAANLPEGQIRILDPAVGDGELLLSLISKLRERTDAEISVYGFDTDPIGLARARQRIALAHPKQKLDLHLASFLDFVLSFSNAARGLPLFEEQSPLPNFDLIIANPPYVRTQIMGAHEAQKLGAAFGLTGRVDLYHAFLIGMAKLLKPGGSAGIIVSNRFMTTQGGASVRAGLREGFELKHIWDLGDTKIFETAVLPAVILASGRTGGQSKVPYFTSIYETGAPASCGAADPVCALSSEGVVLLDDGRRFLVQHGTLNASGPVEDVWRISTKSSDDWLETVASNTWKTFGGITKIRVGVKTCADKVFIRGDWQAMPEHERPELLRRLTTHHSAGCFRAEPIAGLREILYPHEVRDGQRRPVDLADYPKARTYLHMHRKTLEGRAYVIEAGRQWYEIWVPQDPAAWEMPKLVFRDISESPTFWLDLDGTVINGDCYWMTVRPGEEDLLWLAASVANSGFIEAFYDRRFNNKLYAGRRRFMTQYVELFPLPDPSTSIAREIVTMAKEIYERAGTEAGRQIEEKLEPMVWWAFGLDVEEIGR
jgi:tRNA1(Val) A37 N6-methylase TrmN6